MSRIGNPYDNAKAESFMKTLKHEQVDGTKYRDVDQARRSIGVFIEEVYNHQRLHSALSYRPPAEFEALHRSSTAELVGLLQRAECLGCLLDTAAMQPIARAGYHDYFVSTPDTKFSIRRPQVA